MPHGSRSSPRPSLEATRTSPRLPRVTRRRRRLRYRGGRRAGAGLRPGRGRRRYRHYLRGRIRRFGPGCRVQRARHPGRRQQVHRRQRRRHESTSGHRQQVRTAEGAGVAVGAVAPRHDQSFLEILSEWLSGWPWARVPAKQCFLQRRQGPTTRSFTRPVRRW